MYTLTQLCIKEKLSESDLTFILQSDNQALKSIVQNNNLMPKQIQSHLNIRNLNDDSKNPHTSHVPNTPKQPMHSTVMPAQDSPPTNNDQSNKRTRSKSNSNPNKKHQTSYPTRPSTCPNGQTNIRTFDSTTLDDQSKQNDSNENDFKVAGPRKKSKKASIQKYIKTSGQGRISIDEKFENAKKAVGEIVSISSFDKITTIHSYFQSFKFTISVFDLDKIKDNNNWPRGVDIGRYKKLYAERVSQKSAESSSNTSSKIN
ncbi:unnamed protein product [Brachionus calyciflorus]|uniref:Uncharacterized protein n=1 Tax=Brachionus calyciflorus TaxID=104777 RepID=A0A814H119_9BILA|nr:unnamed protein product [Brachionus calyciflorus]